MIIQYIIDRIRSLKSNDFDGVTHQHERIFNFINDGKWTTLREIAAATGAPEASISAHLRDLRKAKYGSHIVDKRYVGNGVYQYRFIFNGTTDDTQETLGF